MSDPASYGIKTFVSGKALYRSFDHMKTYINSAITSKIEAHAGHTGADANSAQLHIPIPTTAPATNNIKYLSTSSSSPYNPTWTSIPYSSAYSGSSDNNSGTLATQSAVHSLYTNLHLIRNQKNYGYKLIDGSTPTGENTEKKFDFTQTMTTEIASKIDAGYPTFLQLSYATNGYYFYVPILQKSHFSIHNRYSDIYYDNYSTFKIAQVYSQNTHPSPLILRSIIWYTVSG